MTMTNAPGRITIPAVSQLPLEMARKIAPAPWRMPVPSQILPGFRGLAAATQSRRSILALVASSRRSLMNGAAAGALRRREPNQARWSRPRPVAFEIAEQRAAALRPELRRDGCNLEWARLFASRVVEGKGNSAASHGSGKRKFRAPLHQERIFLPGRGSEPQCVVLKFCRLAHGQGNRAGGYATGVSLTLTEIDGPSAVDDNLGRSESQTFLALPRN